MEGSTVAGSLTEEHRTLYPISLCQKYIPKNELHIDMIMVVLRQHM